MNFRKLVSLVHVLRLSIMIGISDNQQQPVNLQNEAPQIPLLTEVYNPVLLGTLLAGLIFSENSFFISCVHSKNALNFCDIALLNVCCSLGIAREIVMNKYTIIDLYYIIPYVMGFHSIILASQIEWFMPWIPFCTMRLPRLGARYIISLWLMSSFILNDVYRIKLELLE